MASAQLVFKKVFGINLVPTETIMWFLELKDSTFQVQQGDLRFTIETGQVGINEKEKLAISLFMHSDERDPRFIDPVLSLNLSTHVQLEIPSDLDDRMVGNADLLVKPFIHPAFVAP